MKDSPSLDQFLPPRELWPALVVPDEFSWLPPGLNLAEELLDRHIEGGRSDRVALYLEDRKITYGEIADRTNRLGSGLSGLGIASRDRVGIRLPNVPEAIVANFSILKIGAIPVPISPLWSRSEIAHAGRDAGLKAIVVSGSLLSEVAAAKEAIPSLESVIVVDDGAAGIIGRKGYHAFEEVVGEGGPRLDPVRLKRDEVAILLYTSGTTGAPKGCAHTTAGVLIESALLARYVFDLKETDVLGGSAPISFAAGFGTFALAPFASRAAVSLLPKFSARPLFENIVRHGVTVLTGIPTAYRKLLEFMDSEEYDLGDLRLCTSGGDALGPATFHAWMAKTGLPIWENLGATEFYHVMVSNRMGSHPVPGSIGLPLAGFEARVVDEKGETCEPGATGSLYLKGPTGILYWNPRGQEGRLMEAQKKNVKDGWSKVGDMVYRDESGHLFFVSREDDMIKSAGYRISPAEIEEVLGRHPLVRESAVIGVPDPVLGQSIKAYIVAGAGCADGTGLEDGIKEHCRRSMALYKLPRSFEFVPSLPRTLTDKVSRKELRAMSGAPPAPVDEMQGIRKGR